MGGNQEPHSICGRFVGLLRRLITTKVYTLNLRGNLNMMPNYLNGFLVNRRPGEPRSRKMTGDKGNFQLFPPYPLKTPDP